MTMPASGSVPPQVQPQADPSASISNPGMTNSQIRTTAYRSLQPLDDLAGLNQLAQLTSGNAAINDHPGLMNAMLSSNATPPQAQAINQFINSMSAVNLVNHARATGAPLTLTPEQEVALQSMGTPYQDVLHAQAQSQQQQLVSQQQTLAAKGLQVARDQDGNPILDANGNVKLEPIPAAHKGGNWFTKLGGGVLHALGVAGNFVQGVFTEASNLTGAGMSAKDYIDHPNGSTTAAAANLQRADGYGTDFASTLAYMASGKMRNGAIALHYQDQWQASGAADRWGVDQTQAMSDALTWSKDPGEFNRQIENDPSLSMQQKAQKIEYINSQDFQDLARRVGSTAGGLGNEFAYNAGIDPAKHPMAFAATSAPLNLIQGFYTDPLILLGKARLAVKAAQVGLRAIDGSAATGDRIREIYTADTSGLKQFTQRYTYQAQQTAQTFLDRVNTIRDAAESGGTDTQLLAKADGAVASIRAETPAFLPLLNDLAPSERVAKVADAEGNAINGIVQVGRIRTPAEFGEYLASKDSLARLTAGKAAQEWSYLPGTTGLRFAKSIQGALAGNKAEAASLRAYLAGDSKVLEALPIGSDAVPLSDLQKSVQDAETLNAPIAAANNSVKTALNILLTARTSEFEDATAKFEDALASARNAGVTHPTAMRILESAKNGVENPSQLSDFRQQANGMLGEVEQDANAVGGAPASQLASAKRALNDRLTAINDPLNRAEMYRNAFRKGTEDGNGWDWGNLARVRAEAVGRRLTSYLPRNNEFNLLDNATTEKVYRYGRLFLNDADAARLTRMFVSSDLDQKTSILQGLLAQTMHSAGLGASDEGRALMAKYLGNFGKQTLDGDEAAGSVGHLYSTSGLAGYRDPNNGGRLSASAIHLADVQSTWTLPSFQDLLKVSANNTLSMKFFNGILGSKLANSTMHVFKTFQLLKPSTWTRNALEGWLNTFFRGEGYQALAVKHLLDESDRNIISDLRQTAKNEGWGKQQLKDAIDEQRNLYARRLGQDKLAQIAPVARMVSVYHAVTGKFAGDIGNWVDWLRDLEPGELRDMADGFGEQRMQSELDPMSQKFRDVAIRNGMTPVPWRTATETKGDANPFWSRYGGDHTAAPAGWTRTATEGYDGAEKLSGALNKIMAGDPEVGREIFKAVAGQSDAAGVLAKIKSNPETYATFRQMRLAGVLSDPVLGDRYVEAGNQAEKDTAELGLADRMVADAKYHVTGSDTDGAVHDGAVKYMIRNGEAPDANWIMKNMTDAERPSWVAAPAWVAVPADGVGEEPLARALNTVAGVSKMGDNAYQFMVEHPIQRTTTIPIFSMNYAKSRQFYEGLKPNLLAEGFNEEAANALLKEYSMKAAWVRTEATVDDPGLMTQLDIVGRNFFAYSRAAQAMVRRWGQAIIEDPSRVEKAALIFGAAEHTGLIYKDQNGELTYTYPGSGALLNAITRIQQFIPGMKHFSMIPFKSDLTGKVFMSMPGIEGAGGGSSPSKLVFPGFTSMVNVPMRAIATYAGMVGGKPGQEIQQYIDWLDKTANGSIGAGQIGANFEPTLLKKFFTAMDHSTSNGTFASAYLGALQNSLAAHLDGLGPNPTDSQKQQFLDRNRIATINNLWGRAVLGAFLPAAPSGPDMTIKGHEADPAFKAEGIKSLRQEYTQMINDFNGNVGQANALWSQLHPDELVYEVPFTTGKKGVYLPATDGVMNWLNQNTAFVQKYNTVAPYFVPPAQGGFSQQAYDQELALGLRVRQAPSAFLDAMLMKIQSDAFYTNLADPYHAERQQLVNSGDVAGRRALDKQYQALSKQFRDANPIYGGKAADQAVLTNEAKQAINQFQEILNNRDVPGDFPAQGLQDMINSYNNYTQWSQTHPAVNSSWADMKTYIANDYHNHMMNVASSDARLTSIYNGIFRQIDTNLLAMPVQ